MSELITSSFIKMIDDLIDYSEQDLELKNGIAWIDKQSQNRGISFYEMIYFVLCKDESFKDRKGFYHHVEKEWV